MKLLLQHVKMLGFLDKNLFCNSLLSMFVQFVWILTSSQFLASAIYFQTEQELPKVKRSTGIPVSFMKIVDNPHMPGAMLTKDGTYAVSKKDAWVKPIH